MTSGLEPTGLRPIGPGSSHFFLGPMCSEKTAAVNRCLKRARLGGFNCVHVKHADDNRYGAGPTIRSHDGSSVDSCPAEDGRGHLRIIEARTLADVELSSDEQDVGIDEGQFYPDLRAVVDRWMKEGRRVYVAALDGDYRREPFPPVAEAFSLATSIVKLTAICMMCSTGGNAPVEAPYTIRTVDSPEVTLIGGREKYKAVCLACYCVHEKKATSGVGVEPARQPGLASE